ncbi:MAG: HNH endonuclease signature motif containing protein [Sulfuricella sp.]
MSIKYVSKVKTNHRISAALRQKMLEKYDHACVVCGVKDDVVPLQITHLVPLSSGGESSEENLTILCPNCHLALDRQPREIEFVSFLAELLKHHPNFTDVQQEMLLVGRENRYRVDLLANRREKGVSEILLIECKTYLVLTSSHINNVIAHLEEYQAMYGDCRMVLAVPATLRDKDLLALNAANIEAWDLGYIAAHYSEQIRGARPSYYKALFLAQAARPKNNLTREQELLNALFSCNPGKADCYLFQSLVGEIFEWLFTPPLGKPISELSDKSQANRRDFIMPNYAENGFWSFLRQKYEADYIVIDAKNNARKVKKSEVLQIANYLKPHGAGLFGLIISRIGGDASGCEHTLREQWLVHRKLILVLDDEDIKAMLMAKSDGRPPEDILGQKIEHFRLSM